ncbi:MAG: hypothetical protein ABSC53_07230 [Bacteroidota bacterium]
MFEKLKSYITKILNAKMKGKIYIHFDGSGKWENVRWGIELNNETKLNEDLIP